MSRVRASGRTYSLSVIQENRRKSDNLMNWHLFRCYICFNDKNESALIVPQLRRFIKFFGRLHIIRNMHLHCLPWEPFNLFLKLGQYIILLFYSFILSSFIRLSGSQEIVQCFFSCVRLILKHENDESQILHFYGLSPVWIRWWTVNWCCKENRFSQNKHWSGFSPVWEIIWVLRLRGCVNALAHIWHL